MATIAGGSAATGDNRSRLHFPNLTLCLFTYCRTDDSDQMILILETIIELNGSVDERLYAAKLKVQVRVVHLSRWC